METRDQIRKLNNILQNSDDVLFDGIRKLQRSFFSVVKKILGEFATVDGFIDKSSPRNRKIIRSLRTRIREALKSTTYQRRVSEFISSFDEVAKLNRNIQRGLSDIDIDDRIQLTAIQKEFVDKISNNLLSQSAIDANLVNPIRTILRRAAVSGIKVKDAEDILRTHIRGEVVRGNQKASEIEKYVRINAFEAINRYNGEVQTEIGAAYDMDGIQMSGTIIKTSSQQCRDMLHGEAAFAQYHLGNGIYLTKNIPDLIRILKTYKGITPGLNENNLQALRLHIGCRHSFFSVIVARRYRRVAVEKGLLTLEEANL